MTPRNGPCSPWIQGSDVATAPWVKAAVEAAEKKGSYSAEQVSTICAQAASAASEILYEMSGRIFTGACGPVTVRPVSRPAGVEWQNGTGWFSSWGSCGYAWGSSHSGVVSHFGCSNPPEIDLGAFPVLSIDEVKIDGVVIPSDEYLLLDFKTLVRMLPTAQSNPTEVYGWPTCQRLDLPDTEDGTFSVTYHYGQLPPAAGLLAVKKLAEHLALPQLGDSTKYPQRVTNIQRQGVSAMVVDVIDIVKTGKTGIYEVDIFLRATNPNQTARQSTVWSPDVGRTRRY